MKRVLNLLKKKQDSINRPLVVCIDGRCGSGKTTLANFLKQELDCEVIHMDHFFLQKHQRTPFRYSQAGGNFDYERFIFEVKKPLQANEEIVYQRFSCVTMNLEEKIKINRSKMIIVEGTYSCHPFINDIYDFKIFVTVDKEEQLRRLKERDGEFYLDKFIKEWIPMEEAYFRVYAIDSKADMLIELEA